MVINIITPVMVMKISIISKYVDAISVTSTGDIPETVQAASDGKLGR